MTLTGAALHPAHSDSVAARCPTTYRNGLAILAPAVRLAPTLATPRGKTGRGKKTTVAAAGVSENTVAAYRKVAKHSHKIDAYHASLKSASGEQVLRRRGSDGMRRDPSPAPLRGRQPFTP